MPFPITCNAVGDIVTVVQLALGIYQALNDSRGSSADFQDVSSEIRRLSRDLSQVQSVIQHADVPKDFADTISKDIASCQAIIDDFQERIAPFGRALGPSSVPRGWALRAARKLDWRRCHASDITCVVSAHRQLPLVQKRIEPCLLQGH